MVHQQLHYTAYFLKYHSEVLVLLLLLHVTDTFSYFVVVDS